MLVLLRPGGVTETRCLEHLDLAMDTTVKTEDSDTDYGIRDTGRHHIPRAYVPGSLQTTRLDFKTTPCMSKILNPEGLLSTVGSRL